LDVDCRQPSKTPEAAFPTNAIQLGTLLVKRTIGKLQFTLYHYLALVSVFCITLALLVNEQPDVVIAALFASISVAGVAVLASFSARHLIFTIRQISKRRNLRPLISRIKWLLVDGIIAIWLIACVAAVNQICANASGHAIWLVVLAAVSSPLAIWRMRLFS
jgi:hypothetical protein